MRKLSSLYDICVFSESLLSDGSLVRGEYMGVTFELEEGGEGFKFDLGTKRLKGRLGKCR